MASIRQNTYSDVLPDFRNVGVMARILVAVNALALGAALFAASDLMQAVDLFVRIAARVEPLLLLALMALAALAQPLARIPYWGACTAVVALVVVLAAFQHAAVRALGGDPLPDLGRLLALSALVTIALLAYFRLLTKAFSPALVE